MPLRRGVQAQAGSQARGCLAGRRGRRADDGGARPAAASTEQVLEDLEEQAEQEASSPLDRRGRCAAAHHAPPGPHTLPRHTDPAARVRSDPTSSPMTFSRRLRSACSAASTATAWRAGAARSLCSPRTAPPSGISRAGWTRQIETARERAAPRAPRRRSQRDCACARWTLPVPVPARAGSVRPRAARRVGCASFLMHTLLSLSLSTLVCRLPRAPRWYLASTYFPLLFGLVRALLLFR